MTDTDELKRLAEAANVVRRDANGRLDGRDAERIWFQYLDAANPKAILALIAENERLKSVNTKRAAIIADLVMERYGLARIDAANNTVA